MKSFKQYLKETGYDQHYPGGMPIPPGWKYNVPTDQSVPVDPKPEPEPEKPAPVDLTPWRWKFPHFIPYPIDPGNTEGPYLPPPFLPFWPGQDEYYDEDDNYLKEPIDYFPWYDDGHNDPDTIEPVHPLDYYHAPEKWKDKHFPGWREKPPRYR